MLRKKSDKTIKTNCGYRIAILSVSMTPTTSYRPWYEDKEKERERERERERKREREREREREEREREIEGRRRRTTKKYIKLFPRIFRLELTCSLGFICKQ